MTRKVNKKQHLLKVGDYDMNQVCIKGDRYAFIEVQLEKKVVPSAVFQGLVDEEGKPTAGAWKRLSKRKK
jgi:hypothetical protein